MNDTKSRDTHHFPVFIYEWRTGKSYLSQESITYCLRKFLVRMNYLVIVSWDYLRDSTYAFVFFRRVRI